MSLWHRGSLILALSVLFAATIASAEPPIVQPAEASAPSIVTGTDGSVVDGGDGSVEEARARAAATWPFNPPSVEAERQSPRKVFAHWHVFPISYDNAPAGSDHWSETRMKPEGEKGKYAAGGGMTRERPLPRPVISGSDWEVQDMETEVRRASAIGLDGFMFNIVNPNNPKLFQMLPQMLEAAQRVDPSFKVALMIDGVTNRDRSVDDVADGILRVASHPSVFRTSDGRLVLSSFAAERKPVEWWKQLFAKLAASGVKVYFVPVFMGYKDEVAAFAPISEGLSDWGRRNVNGADVTLGAAAQAHGLGKIWMAPVASQSSRPKSLKYWEAGGSQSYRENWQLAIDDGADWAQIITWNDYGEATEIAPSTGTQYATYDLSAYYIAWFKTGKQPPITRDVLYYYHRIMPTTAQGDPSLQSAPFEIQGGQPAQNSIELLAFLTAPGTLEIDIGGKTYQQRAPAGITSFKAPLAAGRPQFRLVRDGSTVIDFESAFDIRDKVEFQDFLYRAGSSSRPPVEMIANPPIDK